MYTVYEIINGCSCESCFTSAFMSDCRDYVKSHSGDFIILQDD